MSRIHEALAKAMREKESQGSGKLSPAIADIAAEVEQPLPAAEEVSIPEAETESHTSKTQDSRFGFVGIHKRCARPSWKLDSSMNIFLPEAQDRIGAERFRTLRSRIHQIADTKQLKIILVTSSLPAEGKSFVCANLAHAMVQQQDRSVLLIDADLRLPSQHKIFGASRAPGLSNYIRGEVDEYAAIQKGMESNLFLMPAGDEVSNPSELLLNDRTEKLIKMASEAFDWVILDSPPALPVHDASTLADLCDGVLFVVRAGGTDFEAVTKASNEFRKKNLLGIAFNHAESGASYGNQYYY